MTALATRLAKLETARGADDLDRWVRSLSDEELEDRIAEIARDVDARLTERSIARDGRTTMACLEQLIALEQQEAANG